MNEEVIGFIKENSVGVISTCDENNIPHGVPVYYYFSESEENLYFVTKDETKKYSKLNKNNKAAFVIFIENPQTVFTADCTTELIDPKSDGFIDITNELIKTHSNQDYYPPPIDFLKEGSLKLIKLKIESHNFTIYKNGTV